MRRPPLTRGSGGFRLGSWRRRQRHPRLSGAFSTRTTPHPALIPHDVAGSSRPRPPIPATPGSENPALAGNPRLSPARQEAPRPARHAGGRGFESRRSRKSTCKSAPFVAALGANDRRPPDRSRTDPARGFQVRLRCGKALEIGNFCCESRHQTTCRPSSHPAQIPHANGRSPGKTRSCDPTRSATGPSESAAGVSTTSTRRAAVALRRGREPHLHGADGQGGLG